jgi:hypothetical protein
MLAIGDRSPCRRRPTAMQDASYVPRGDYLTTQAGLCESWRGGSEQGRTLGIVWKAGIAPGPQLGCPT